MRICESRWNICSEGSKGIVRCLLARTGCGDGLLSPYLHLATGEGPGMPRAAVIKRGEVN